MTGPLVSICMPAHNCAPCIGQTLGALAEQSWPHWECIVINDGSTDDTLAVAQRHASSRIRVLTQENQGQSATENRAIAEAQGEFFVFLDADDLMSPNKLKAQIEVLGDSSVRRMATCAWGRFHRDPERAEFRPSPLWKTLAPLDWLTTAWENNLMMHGATWLIPRPLVEASGGWNADLSLINDHEFFPRVMRQCEEIVFTPEVKTYYRSGVEGNLSGQRTRKAWLSAYTALALSTESALATWASELLRHACASKFQRFVYEIYPEHDDLRRRAEDWVRRLGGSNVSPDGGRWFQRVRGVIGWKGARRMERLAFRLGYRAAGMKSRWSGH